MKSTDQLILLLLIIKIIFKLLQLSSNFDYACIILRSSHLIPLCMEWQISFRKALSLASFKSRLLCSAYYFFLFHCGIAKNLTICLILFIKKPRLYAEKTCVRTQFTVSRTTNKSLYYYFLLSMLLELKKQHFRS